MNALVLVALLALPGAALAGDPAPARPDVMKTLLARHLGATTLKQLALEDAIGGSDGWNVDLEEGVIWFDDGERHAIQLLGTHSDVDGTWLWAWANTVSDLPPAVVRASERLRQLGTEKGWAALTTRKLPRDQADGHRIAVVACGLLGGAAYYRGPYDDGAAFFLLTDFPRKDHLNTRPERLLTAIMTAISLFEVDLRELIRGLAADLQLKLVERPAHLTLTARDGSTIEFSLDSRGRVSDSSVTLTK